MENFENERYISSYFAYLNKQRANPAPEPFKYQPVKQSSKIKEQIKALAGGDIDSESLSDKILTFSFEEREKLLALLLELFNLTGDTNLLSLIDLLKKSLDDSVKKEKADKKDEKAYTEVDRSNENARQKTMVTMLLKRQKTAISQQQQNQQLTQKILTNFQEIKLFQCSDHTYSIRFQLLKDTNFSKLL